MADAVVEVEPGMVSAIADAPAAGVQSTGWLPSLLFAAMIAARTHLALRERHPADGVIAERVLSTVDALRLRIWYGRCRCPGRQVTSAPRQVRVAELVPMQYGQVSDARARVRGLSPKST